MYEKYDDFFSPRLLLIPFGDILRDTCGLSVGCWTELYTFSLVNQLIQSFMILTWLISKQMREDNVSVAARTFFSFHFSWISRPVLKSRLILIFFSMYSLSHF